VIGTHVAPVGGSGLWIRGGSFSSVSVVNV